MFLRAGAVSLLLLLVSRVLGLVRESAQAAAFGATGGADIAVVMLTLPDWIAGLLASGALAYVLLPAWAATGAPVAAIQRRVLGWLLPLGAALGLALALAHAAFAAWLLPGLQPALRNLAGHALVWSAVALPLALVASLWATRLQFERDFTGVYGANVAANLVMIATLLALAIGVHPPLASALAWLGGGLVAAMLGRLAWLGWRTMDLPPAGVSGHAPAELPPLATWLWAAAAAGLPLALPFVARTLASNAGDGALATFNYAWKLVELPLLLAVQLVATLALGPIAQALAAADADGAALIIRRGFALAWTLACASAAGLLVAAPALADLLFGWGRMDAAALVQVADWARIGAWGLLPQALTSVALAVLAARGQLRPAAVAYGVALLVLLAAGPREGGALMAWTNGLHALVCVVLLALLGRGLRHWLPWRTLVVAGGAVLLLQFVLVQAPASQAGAPLLLGGAVLSAALLIALSWLASPDLRGALRR